MKLDTIQIVAIVLACIVAAVAGIIGMRLTVGYVTCHRQVESLGLGLTPAYDPLTGTCTVRL